MKCHDIGQGLKTSHCAGPTGCHQTFSTVANFDKHRVGGTCADPVTVGLVKSSRKWGEVWHAPGKEADD